MALGNKLKDLLYKKGLTVKEFAKQIGVPSTTLYSFIQRDSQDAKIDLVMKICTGLGITLNEFVGDSEVIDGEEGVSTSVFIYYMYGFSLFLRLKFCIVCHISALCTHFKYHFSITGKSGTSPNR